MLLLGQKNGMICLLCRFLSSVFGVLYVLVFFRCVSMFVLVLMIMSVVCLLVVSSRMLVGCGYRQYLMKWQCEDSLCMSCVIVGFERKLNEWCDSRLCNVFDRLLKQCICSVLIFVLSCFVIVGLFFLMQWLIRLLLKFCMVMFLLVMLVSRIVMYGRFLSLVQNFSLFMCGME